MLGSAQRRPANALDAARARSERAPTLAPPYLDAHAHAISGAGLAYRTVTGVPRGDDSPVDGTALIRRMDADGVRRAFVLSTAYQMSPDAYGTRTSESAEYARVRVENDFTAVECARYPDRLVPFLSVNPKRGYAVEEIAGSSRVSDSTKRRIWITKSRKRSRANRS
jgi:predicted TIM-barrel fold metal-dependent hydrolase